MLVDYGALITPPCGREFLFVCSEADLGDVGGATPQDSPGGAREEQHAALQEGPGYAQANRQERDGT